MFLRGTLNETLAAQNIGALPKTPQGRPKSKIYTPKRDDEHPRLFHMGVPPPGYRCTIIKLQVEREDTEHSVQVKFNHGFLSRIHE